ncbi:hypothetical protein Drorol1_Dr00025507, partial [Drosera rotundifolia]
RSVVSTFDPSPLSFEDDTRTRRPKQWLGFRIWGSIIGMIPRWVSFWGFLLLFLNTQMLRISGFLGFKHIDIREMRVSISARFLLIWHVTALLLQEAGIEVDPLSDLYTESERKLGELVCEKYGAPLHGGFGASLERVIMLYCGLDNIRMASLFPHDPLRLEP